MPAIVPDVTRVSLHGGSLPVRARRFKAAAPAGLEPGSPFGPGIRAFVVYLRAVQGIPLSPCAICCSTCSGLSISEGALVAILSAAAKPFRAAVSGITARLRASTPWPRTRPGVAVGRRNWWLWVFHHGRTVVRRRSPPYQGVVAAFLGEHRPPSGPRIASGRKAAGRPGTSGLPGPPDPRRQYAREAGDTVLAPGLKGCSNAPAPSGDEGSPSRTPP